MPRQKIYNLHGGLQPLKDDPRDFKLGALFGAPSLADIPQADFLVSQPKEIKDQNGSDLCTAYALCAVSEDQEDSIFEPSYTFAKTKQLMGEYQSWGADLRNACKSAVKFGFLPKEESPFNLSHGRDFVANWLNWDIKLDEIASKYRKLSYFRVEDYGNLFDAIRANLWRFREEKRSILTGVTWCQEWTRSNGIIEELGTPAFGHAIKIFGQKFLDGKPYLIAQLSNGVHLGQNGIFYFSKDVFNSSATSYGAFMFKDLPAENAKLLIDKGLSLKWRLAIKSFLALRSLYNKYL